MERTVLELIESEPLPSCENEGHLETRHETASFFANGKTSRRVLKLEEQWPFFIGRCAVLIHFRAVYWEPGCEERLTQHTHKEHLNHVLLVLED